MKLTESQIATAKANGIPLPTVHGRIRRGVDHDKAVRQSPADPAAGGRKNSRKPGHSWRGRFAGGAS